MEEMKRREVEAFEKYGETFQLKGLAKYIVATMDPKVCEKILGNSTSYLEKATHYSILRAVAGNGLICSPVNKWRGQRKIIQPAFTAMNMFKGFVDIFDKKSQIFVGLMKDRCDGQLIDINHSIERLAGDILMETSMGLQSNDQVTHNSAYIQANNTLTRLCVKRISSYWKRFDILFSTFAVREKRLHDENMAIARDFAMQVIENRRKFLLQQNTANNSDSVDQEDGGKAKAMCFVDTLLQSAIDGEPLSNEDILDQMHTLMIGGQDTTAFTISIALFLLSRHKHVQDQVYGEIKDVFGGEKNSPITYEQLLELKYMELVLKETLRLYPAVTIIGRNIDRDLKLDDGRIIPAGVDVRLYLGMMMRNPKYFTNPDAFCPERFASTNFNHFTYAPFSAGKRDCIGKKFAMFSMKTVLARVLQQYELVEMGEDPIIQNGLVSRSVNGFQMAFKLRDDVQC
ncbi:cytochrome P450 4d2-like [Sitodiplosis mosellana]|uniref:cytochrome P450 4d2-like n=1 Tax=Sitodiplosis mosellana TaxID=263140 RepID=UPI002444F41F|nr:cytochrome P450 4d2-like [Sitodiplosis mosellana]